jgi:aarF domain-containing kinase
MTLSLLIACLLLLWCDLPVSAFQASSSAPTTRRAGRDGRTLPTSNYPVADRRMCRPSATPMLTLSAFQSSSAKSPSTTTTTPRRTKKSLRDRTPEEASSLVRDVIRAAMDAGPRAGPLRVFQAYRAFDQTLREYLPQVLTMASSGGGGGSGGGTSNSITAKIPEILRKLFERMGATYVKLGQFIASSPTIFPAEYVKEFQKCLDQTEPLPWSTIRSVIVAELGELSQTFAYVDETPLASASIAQVHAARLLNGEEVVIKVQKPGIDSYLQADLGFLYVSARVLEFLQPDWERTSLSAVAGDIRASMLEELDFIKEAQNTIAFRRFLQDQGLTQSATAPRVFLEHTTKKVLVMERLDGVSLLDEETIRTVAKNPDVGTETILTALNIWSLSVTGMPFFHADVHAGNLLLLRDGRVGFIDFGIVGRISPKVFQAVNDLSMALVTNDSEAMARALCNMGATDANVNIKQFGRDIDRVLDKMTNVQADVAVMASTRTGEVMGSVSIEESEITNLLLEFVEVTEKNGLKLPREFGLLVKQSLYFDRYLKILAPSVDVLNDKRVQIGGRQRQESSTSTKINGEVVIDV